ncbi:hypothetical protein QCE73_38395 [Caballeronia sp. LZ029]|uniref:hypothetical protein n=1 Tax=Caballeronia sp. LZ029 TaxID=3038564 RepID=UPI00286105E6|nr:hypothetical protein [Caballeronia sp. LZ029]MDR5749027.1 hypothetical protein [Caballeronia sp. LZ029]
MLTLERLLFPDMGRSKFDSARSYIKLNHTRQRVESDAGATPTDQFGLRAIDRTNVLLRLDVATRGEFFYSFSSSVVKPFRRLRIDSTDSVSRCAL